MTDQLPLFTKKSAFITLQVDAGVIHCKKPQLHMLFLGKNKHCFTHASTTQKCKNNTGIINRTETPLSM